MRIRIGLLLLLAGNPLMGKAEKPLSLENYLSQVRTSHEGYRGALRKAGAAEGRRDEVQLQYGTTLFGQLNHSDDQGVPLSPFIPAFATRGNRLNLGLSRQERFGLQSKISYTLQKSRLSDLPPTLSAGDDAYATTAFSLELTQPLWKNRLGADLTLHEEEIALSTAAMAAGTTYQAKQVIIAAEKAYWRLAASKELLKIQQASYTRAEKIRNWQAARVTRNLADESDLLQASAALKMREMELKSAKNAIRLALKVCNELRGQDGAQDLQPDFPATSAILAAELPARQGEREDLKAARLNLESSRKTVQLADNTYKPSLDLVASASLTGKDSQMVASMKESFSREHPQFAIGLRFSMPLDRQLIAASSGAKMEDLAGQALLVLQQREDQHHEWDDLQQKVNDAKDRLRLIKELETAQRLKVTAEKTRLQQGRSTTLQMVLFEQDFLNAGVSRIIAGAEILDLVASLRSFSDIAH